MTAVTNDELADRSDVEALKLALERAQAAQAAAAIGIFDYDLRAGTIYSDARVLDIWGFEAGQNADFETYVRGIHPDDAGAMQAAVIASLKPEGDGRYAATYRVINAKDKRVIWVKATGETSFLDGVPVRLIGTVQDVTTERIISDQRADQERFLSGVLRTAPMQLYIFDIERRCNVYLGPETAQSLGMDYDEIVGMKADVFDSMIHPDDVSRVIAHHIDIQNGATGPFEIRYRMRHANGSWRWFLSRDTVYACHADGRPYQIIGAAIDVTDLHTTERQRDLLINELNHRAKNMLATIQAVIAQTLTNDIDPSVRARLEGRILSMARSYDLLTSEHWDGADLCKVARTSLSPHLDGAEDRIQIRGPDLRVEPRFALSFSMALHELATNATKYGALASPDGHVDLSWTLDKTHMAMAWDERGGPPVSPPTRRGFGSRLIERGFADEFGGDVAMDFRVSGLRCTMRIPWPPQ